MSQSSSKPPKPPPPPTFKAQPSTPRPSMRSEERLNVLSVIGSGGSRKKS